MCAHVIEQKGLIPLYLHVRARYPHRDTRTRRTRQNKTHGKNPQQ